VSEPEQNLSYYAQLKHPKWQRKRLEVLELAGFRCAACQDAESTLHVHHKRYMKGRMAWEYESAELVALCEACHAAEHEDAEIRKHLMALLDVDGPLSAERFFAYGAGALDGSIGDDMELYSLLDHFRDRKPLDFWAGRFGNLVSNRMIGASKHPKLSMEMLCDLMTGDSPFSGQLLKLLCIYLVDQAKPSVDTSNGEVF
jgi:hypothetical protein